MATPGENKNNPTGGKGGAAGKGATNSANNEATKPSGTEGGEDAGKAAGDEGNSANNTVVFPNTPEAFIEALNALNENYQALPADQQAAILKGIGASVPPPFGAAASELSFIGKTQAQIAVTQVREALEDLSTFGKDDTATVVDALRPFIEGFWPAKTYDVDSPTVHSVGNAFVEAMEGFNGLTLDDQANVATNVINVAIGDRTGIYGVMAAMVDQGGATKPEATTQAQPGTTGAFVFQGNIPGRNPHLDIYQPALPANSSEYVRAAKGDQKNVFSRMEWDNMGKDKNGWTVDVETPAEIANRQ